MHAADLRALAAFLLDPAAAPDNALPDAPVDHLTYRFLRGKYAAAAAHFGRRRMMAFRHVLLWHVGDVSAVGNSKQRHKPKCYTTTGEWLFERESFHLDDCPDDDLWPCDRRPAPDSEGGRRLAELARRTEVHAAAARRCGTHRVCWRRPEVDGRSRGGNRTRGGGSGGGGPLAADAARCARSLQCESVGGREGDAPCVPQLPEYAE